jgi:hypothetical protein
VSFVIGLLRFIGLTNAAVWFGAAVFFTIGASPAMHSEAAQQLLGANNYPYYGVGLAHILTARYFHLHLACGIVALLHLGAEWMYLSKMPKRSWLLLVLALFCFALAESLWIQPRTGALHHVAHGRNVAEETRSQARRSLSILQSTTAGLNLLATLSLAFYLWRMASQPAITRFTSTTRFRT